jgi:hypothetical protein
MLLGEYEFGFADATKEFTRKPVIFENAFCDSRGIVNKLINKHQFILIGRKGVGKTAFSAKIQSLSLKSDNQIHTQVMNLNDFEFGTFAKTSIDSDVTGTQKYKSSWDFILLLAIYKIIFNDLEMSEDESINKIIFLLDKAGFAIDNGFKADITRLSKIKLGIGVMDFDIEFEKEFKVSADNYLERITVIAEKMFQGLENIYLNERQVILIIDGLDDILRFRKNKVEIISSLIRSADYVNDKMLRFDQKIKINILIREDIISMLNDPDLNKIIQDGSITLSWENRLDELKEIVDLRFMLSGISKNEASNKWDTIFPRKIRSKSSWNQIIDHTLYKPRDILQFLKYCQDEYPNNETLSLSETQNVLKIYSNKYFIEEMKNELSGFVEEELIFLIPTVLRKLGGRSFSLDDMITLYKEQGTKKKITSDNIKELMLYLFDAGYIGQLLPPIGTNSNKRSVIFKHRNPTARIDYYQKFITHQGLHSGLGVRL